MTLLRRRERSLEKSWRSLPAGAVPVCSLLVVPNYHHRGSSTEDRGFVRWLQELEGQGHEIVIHGYFHERPRRTGENLREKFFTRFYTKGKANFMTSTTRRRCAGSRRRETNLSSAGLTPRGFIAPAWLLGAAAERAATGSGNGIHHPSNRGARFAFGKEFPRENPGLQCPK